jgi:outer membrane protein insertion porin family
MWMVRPLLAYLPFAMLVLAVAQPETISAQATAFEGKLVRLIQFNPRQQPLDPSELHEILPLKTNEPLTGDVVRASIERLFATGRYADIQVSAEPYQDGVAVTFITKNSWFIGDVAVGGKLSDPPNPGQLENATRLELGQPYSDAKLKEGVEGQQRLLENNGLYRSTVTPSIERDEEFQQVNIRFGVDTGPRAYFTTPVLLGDLKMDAGRILSATKFRRWLIHTWKPVTQNRVRQGLDGVRKLYEKENRLEAKVTLEQMKYDPATNRSQATLQIDAGPRIEVNPVGAKISQSKLRRLVPVFEEHAVDHDLLMEGARNLVDYFQSQGYFEAEAEPKEQRVVNDKATIDYLINLGARHKLVHVQIDGNRYFTTEAIRERMYLQTASLLQFPHGRFSENFLRRDENSIVNLYQSNGFRDVRVSHKVENSFRGKPGDLAVFITIEEGPQYTIAHLQVDGIEKIDKAAVLATLSSTEGQPFSDFNVAVDRDTILARYFEGGFPNASFEWNSKPAAAPNQVDLFYVIEEGRQQFVKQVLISPLRFTRPSLVYRNLKLNPGDPLSLTAITDTQRRLYELGIFARVDTAIQNPDGATDHKNVLFELDEARRYSMAVGFGAEFGRIGGCQTCLDAPAGTTGFSPRISFDLTRNNLWGLAHSISLRTRVSTLEQRVLLNYSWPRFKHSDALNLSFTALYQDSVDVRTFSFKRIEGSVQVSQRYSKAVTLFYRYAYRRVSVDQASLKISPLLIPLVSQPVLLGIVSFGAIQDRRDDSVDPHKGVYNTIDLGIAEHAIGSQRCIPGSPPCGNFLRFLGRNATYHQLTKKLILARSIQFGDIYAFRFTGPALSAIPLAERFFGGGGSSNRGFPENGAGPRDPITGFPLGGTALLFNQTELRFPLIGENIGGVLFHDAGNVYSSLSNISFRWKQRDLQDFDYMVHAAGFGIRYRTPIGPLRLDLAYSINPPTFFGFKGSEQDLINAGVIPCSTGKCTVQNVSHFQFFFSIGQTF